MLWISVSKKIDRLWVGCFDKDSSTAVFDRVGEGLRLIEQYDPVRFRHLVRDLDRIWVNVLPGPLGQYQRELKLCVLDQRYVLAEDTTPDLIAAVIVHEATHARLERCGIGYDEPLRGRVEAVCFRRELAFANKLPNGSGAQQRAKRYLEYYTPEKFALPAQLERHERGSAEALRYLGTPEAIIRAILTFSRLVKHMNRLSGRCRR